MSLLKSLWNEFIYGGHFTALMATLFPISVSVLVKAPVSWCWVIPVYLGCYGSYLFNRLTELDFDIKTNPKRSKYLMGQKNKLLIRIILSVVLLLLIPLISEDLITFFFFLILIVLSLSYSIQFKALTRKVPCFKNIYLAFVFSLLSFYPFIRYQQPLWVNGLFLFSFIFFRIFSNSSFCDIKDLESDRSQGLLTLPLLMGIKKMRIFLSMINISFLLLLITGVLAQVFPSIFLTLCPVLIYSLYYQNTSLKDETKIVILSESESFILFCGVLLGSQLF